MTADLKTRVVRADPGAIAAAASILREGGLVAFPTETVYGLGADATNGEAVARLYAAKGRPSFNPLISHVADAASARSLARFDATADALARAFWPGPLTLVLAKAEGCPVSDLATAGLDSIAVRVPDHRVAHALIVATGKPVVAPSANVSGHVSPTSADHVLADLAGRIDLIVDGGSTAVGVESTVVACLGEPVLLRPGGVSRAAIEKVTGRPLAAPGNAGAENGKAPRSPGMLSSHYAPRAVLRLNAADVAPGEALLAFGPAAPKAAITFNLSAAGDLVEAAANLFSHLRALDLAGATRVAVMPVPQKGLGEAINDRLRRAAAPRQEPP
jgi:L-threonylcarbamoyladenylate synthase